MKTHNTDAVHQIDVTRGRKNTNRAGSQGISVLDATGTNVHPITDLLFGDGFTVTDGDDGMAIVNASSPFPGDDPAPAGTPTVTVESTAGTSATVNVPAGVVDGMVMILAIWKDDNASVSTGVAAGWTEIVQGTNGSFFVRVADNEPASYNVSYGPTNRRAVVSITAFENVDTVTPIGGFSTAGDVSLSLPNADYYLLASIELNRGDVTFGAPTGWTMLAEGDTGGSGTDHVAAALAGKEFTGSAADGPITFDIDIGDADANTQIALRRASDQHAIDGHSHTGTLPDLRVETTIVDHGNMGATETIDVSAGLWHRGTLTADCTITVTGFTANEARVAVCEFTQDGTGGWAITWDADVDFGTGDDQPAQAASALTLFLLASSAGDAAIIGSTVGGASASAQVIYEPLTSGASSAPELVFDMDGRCIMVPVA